MSEQTANQCSLVKIEANRRNGQKSTGPKTAAGKATSKWNSLKHGLLSRQVVIQQGEGKENRQEFLHLQESLRQDLQPLGVLEELLVEKIAVEYWRLKRAIQCEAGVIRRGFASPLSAYDDYVQCGHPELQAIRSHLSLPDKEAMERILRYETTINRQLFQAMNQLERLQRQRKGEAVPAPINIEISGEK